jgi:hypothetical protein
MEEWNLQKIPMDGFTPFSANVVTYQERPLLPSGTYTVAQNVRDYRPGLRKRPGLAGIAPYNFLGSTIDIRPIYGDSDGAGNQYLSTAWGYSDPSADQATARANVVDNFVSGTEFTTSTLGVGWKKGAGGTYQVGRCTFSTAFCTIYHYVTNITAASIFYYMKGYEGPDPDINGSAIRLVVIEVNDYDPRSTSPPNDNNIDDPEEPIVALSDVFELDPSNYGTDHIVEIPLNATGVALLNDQLDPLLRQDGLGLMLVEYDWDFLEDTGGSSSTNINHQIHLRMDRYFPFLRITYSDDVPACVSIYQFNQVRNEATETLAYFENGDILSHNVAPPTTRGDVRPTVTGGDNGGYYPYSDGLPSSHIGLSESIALTPSYDSKWGKYVFRSGRSDSNDTGYNDAQDFSHYWFDEDSPFEINPFKPSWAVLDDTLVFANGDRYAKFYTGLTGSPCKFGVGVIDPLGNDTGTIFDDWDQGGIEMKCTNVAYDDDSEMFLYSDIPFDKLFYEKITRNFRGLSTWYTWDGNSWNAIPADEINDATIGNDGSYDISLFQDGFIYSRYFIDNKPQKLYGLSGYWVKFKMDSNYMEFRGKWKIGANFSSLENVWDGVPLDAIEAQFYNNNDSAYYTYANTAIDVSVMTTSDYVYFATQYIPVTVFIDVGNTPNTNAATLTFEFWDGENWQTWTIISDGSNGCTQTGGVKLDRTTVEDEEDGSQVQEFNNSVYGLHWFRFKTSAQFSADTRISITYEPVLDIGDFGSKVNCCAVWKERMVYSFDAYPSWIYVTKNNTVNVLNGDDYAVLQAGDGRRNDVLCMKKFHNELLVWQEEKGEEGGCTTIFEGYNPSTFGKFLLSAKIGILNADCAVVVDGALQASRDDYNAATLAYFMSNYGIFFTDGQTIRSIHDAIRNYFDPTSPDCIRNGYQQYCWLSYDETHHVLRAGIVSGASATEPNIFPVFDLMTRRWSFDAFASAHTPRCMSEVSGDSLTSAVQVVMLAGSKDGDMFNASSSNLNDNGDTAIDAQVRIEFGANGHLLNLNEFAVRFKRQAAGSILFKVYENGVHDPSVDNMSETIDMTQGESEEEAYVERLLPGAYQDNNVSIFLQNNTIDQDMYLLDYWVDMDKLMNR